MTGAKPALTADEIIAQLRLEPHPEGGFFRETFRDRESSGAGARAASTAIYYLLKAGEVSRWHRVDAAEVWHWYAGAPLELAIAAPDGGSPQRATLGNRLDASEFPQAVVPAGYWQQARSLGDYTLVGCTVAPGFLFESFELAPPGFEPGGAGS
jgi:uncharacterized protein